MDRLDNTVRTYAWGSATALPELMGTEPTGGPQAELWMGAHPGAPSRIDRGAGPVSLADVIADDPVGELGRATVDAFGPQLPFLLKILAAETPLSLQVHPDLAQAKAGFADEEVRGIPVDAPHRTYKDANHKPELICALTPFDGLCGFRPAAEAADLLDGLGVDQLKPYADLLRAKPEGDALREVLTAVLTAERGAMAETVTLAGGAARRLADETPAYAPYAELATHYPGDPGVIAALLLNHVVLAPGEALYLGAGVPHAYLNGLGVEIMANSDNVLRCGLTPKHVDVAELLRIVRFEVTPPGVLRPVPTAGAPTAGAPGGGTGEDVFAAPIGEFRLSRLRLTPGSAAHPLPESTPQILLCTAGRVRLRGADGSELALEPGRSAYVRAGERVGATGEGTLFRATTAP
ncbi:mannose-6-phosphate isomerase, class I [Streptomyces sp. SBT349]|uniref:mannose-6-phosphate isomerase, class I n=1 Tax=Streptomyces sp. SBT349 TaxID=1580539 RepID=UPI00066BC4F9|nr:mannose-6-phosphate isomerase, class I [Streptomyces sp. SBT349]